MADVDINPFGEHESRTDDILRQVKVFTSPQ